MHSEPDGAKLGTVDSKYRGRVRVKIVASKRSRLLRCSKLPIQFGPDCSMTHETDRDMCKNTESEHAGPWLYLRVASAPLRYICIVAPGRAQRQRDASSQQSSTDADSSSSVETASKLLHHKTEKLYRYEYVVSENSDETGLINLLLHRSLVRIVVSEYCQKNVVPPFSIKDMDIFRASSSRSSDRRSGIRSQCARLRLLHQVR